MTSAPDGKLNVVLDVTPLAGQLTGIGRFTYSLVEALSERSALRVSGWPVTFRGRGAVKAQLPAGVPMVGRPVPARALRALWRRSSFPPAELLCGPCDVVHGTNFVVPPTRRAAKVVSVHDLTFIYYPEMCTSDTLQYAQLVKRAIATGAVVHTDTNAVRDEVILELGADPDRVMTAHLGVPPSIPGNASTGLRLAGSERYVLAIGTVEPRKGYPLLVDAFDLVASTHPDERLVNAGSEGWGAAALDDAVASSPNADRIVRTGRVSDQQRADLLAGATMLAYPSLYEGFGFPPLEAMEAGVPVVASSVPAVSEVVGEAGLLASPLDPVAWAESIERVLDDYELANRLVSLGRIQVRSFSWSQLAEQMEDIYRRAVDLRK